jgi:HD-GYP domain-containing protein (c-di-GMP phosphodiesterase class II)
MAPGRTGGVQSGNGLDGQNHVLRQVLRAVAAATNGPDPYMAGHSWRVAEYADRLAVTLGLSTEQRFLLHLAALFHDIGVLSTPAYILRKPSVLAEDEMEEVRIHPVRGATIFGADPALQPVAQAIRHHHERVDGTGYPDGLAGDAIPLFSRIILIAETYEALTHHRPYRRALTASEALRRLQESAGTQLDPHLVEAFIPIVLGDAKTSSQ